MFQLQFRVVEGLTNQDGGVVSGEAGTSTSYDGKLNQKNVAVLYKIEGTPEEVSQVKGSYTGQYLAEILATNRKATATKPTKKK